MEDQNTADDLVSEKGYSHGFPGDKNNSSNGNGNGNGKIRWLNCTPLLGSDDRVGVWMIVMVEDEKVTGSLLTGRQAQSQSQSQSQLQSESSRRTIPNSPSMATPTRDEWDGMRGPRSKPVMGGSRLGSMSVSGQGQGGGGGGGMERSLTDLDANKTSNSGGRRRPSTSTSTADGGGGGGGGTGGGIGETKRRTSSSIWTGRRVVADESSERRLMSL